MKEDQEKMPLASSATARRFRSTSPMYPIALQYSSGGLYYYSSSCCRPYPVHTGTIVSNMQLSPLGCGANPVENFTRSGSYAILVEPIKVPNSIIFEESRSFGVLVDSNNVPKLGALADVIKSLEASACNKTGYSGYYGCNLPVNQFKDPVVFYDPNNQMLFDGAEFILRQVFTALEARPYFLMAHQIEKTNTAVKATLSGLEGNDKDTELVPYIGTLETAEPSARHWEVMILHNKAT